MRAANSGPRWLIMGVSMALRTRSGTGVGPGTRSWEVTAGPILPARLRRAVSTADWGRPGLGGVERDHAGGAVVEHRLAAWHLQPGWQAEDSEDHGIDVSAPLGRADDQRSRPRPCVRHPTVDRVLGAIEDIAEDGACDPRVIDTQLGAQQLSADQGGRPGSQLRLRRPDPRWLGQLDHRPQAQPGVEKALPPVRVAEVDLDGFNSHRPQLRDPHLDVGYLEGEVVRTLAIVFE